MQFDFPIQTLQMRSPSADSPAGLSPGAIAGIAIGAVVGAAVLGGAGLFAYRLAAGGVSIKAPSLPSVSTRNWV